MEFETSVETVEVAEQPEVSVEEQEVAEPVVSETTEKVEQEVTPPARDKERDSWFAEKRRELEAREKEIESKFQSQLEAERQRIAELETKTKTYEVNDRNSRLKEFAEQNNLNYDELVAEADRQEELERTQAEKEAELQNEKSEKQKLAEEKTKLENELYSLKMQMEDRAELLKFDPNIDLNELGDDFYQFRSLNGKTPIEAYKLAQALKPETVVAESPGKLNSTQTESEYYTEAEWDSMSDEQQTKLLNDPATYPKVSRSHKKWISK